MPRDKIDSCELKIIHNVNALNGNKQIKKDKTTAPSIRTTCLLAFRLSSGLLGLIFIIAPFLETKFLAIIPYKSIKINNGIKKNMEIVIKKYPIDQVEEACVKHTGTSDPSMYSTYLYSATLRMGLKYKAILFSTFNVL